MGDAPGVHDDDAVAKDAHLVQIFGNEQDGCAAIAVILQEISNELDAGYVETACR